MSSGIVDTTRSTAHLKKARIERACDICRKKKIRCDGLEATGNPCTHCTEFDLKCTYFHPTKRRGRPRSYVESLENRIEKLENIIQSLCPNDAAYKGIMRALDADQWVDHAAGHEMSSSGSGIASSFVDGVIKSGTVLTPLTSASVNTGEKSDDEDDINNILADSLKRLQLEPPEYRFLGKSSGLMLIRTALDLKNSQSAPVNSASEIATEGVYKGRATMKNIRMEYWMPLPWETSNPHTKAPPNPTFLEPDLALHLIDLYFRHMNIYLPLLHRPTFMKLISDKALINSDYPPEDNDDPFALVYLLVCAVGARYSDDPRCLLDGVTATSPHATHSNGWKWFHQAQAQAARRNIISPPTLFDIQFFALAAQFLIGSSAPQAAWTLIGFGVRVAQDVGAHRKKKKPDHISADEEMLKRAFWTLVCMDGIVSASFGRACAIHDEDFDLDLPIDCDDEYWNTDNQNPDKRFKQPEDKPSLIASFIMLIKLNRILGIALRKIYSTNKTPAQRDMRIKSEQIIVAELDSTLNEFADSLPEHLKWDPAKPDEVFFTQSASLYSLYYHVQILVHRSFIPSPTKPSPEYMPSMAMCTNAARNCCRIVEMVRKRGVYVAPEVQMAVFTSSMVLLLNIWGSRLAGVSETSAGVQRDTQDVYKCMHVLRSSESRWHIMGRLWDILRELVSASDLIPTEAAPGEGRGMNLNTTYQPNTFHEFHEIQETHSAYALLSHVRDTTQISVASTPFPTNSDLFGLPAHPNSVVGFESSHSSSEGLGINYPPYNLETSGLLGDATSHWDYVSGQDQEQYLTMRTGSFVHNADLTASAVQSQLPTISEMQSPQQFTQSWMPHAQPNQGDVNLMTMWSNAPDGFRLEEWDAYLTSVGEIMHQTQVPNGS